MKHLLHFKSNTPEVQQCTHSQQLLSKSDLDFGNAHNDSNTCCCTCRCRQNSINHQQNYRMQKENAPFLQVNQHKLGLFWNWVETGVERLMYNLLYIFFWLFFFFCIMSCEKQKNAAEYQKSALEKNQAGQFEAAIADCNRAIQLKANYAEPYNNRGWAKYNLGRYEEAISDFTKSIELNDKFIKPIVNRGNAFLKLQKYQEAETDFDRAIQLNPDYKNAYKYKGDLYKILERTEESEIWYAKSK